MSTRPSPPEFVTLASNDGFEFIIPRTAACVSGTIRRMLDPASGYPLAPSPFSFSFFLFFTRNPLQKPILTSLSRQLLWSRHWPLCFWGYEVRFWALHLSLSLLKAHFQRGVMEPKDPKRRKLLLTDCSSYRDFIVALCLRKSANTFFIAIGIRTRITCQTWSSRSSCV